MGVWGWTLNHWHHHLHQDTLVSGSHDVTVGSGIKQALFGCNPS